MADYLFAGLPLERGDLVIPLVGVWHADLYFSDGDASVTAGQTAVLTVLGVDRQGTVTRAGAEGGFVRARVVGGSGKMDVVLQPMDYRGYTAGQIASQCLQEAGEIVGGGWDAWTTSCPHWTRPQAPLREVLRRIARTTPDSGGDPTADGALHWVSVRAGKIALITETWPANKTAVHTEGYVWPQERCAQFWPADGGLSPGQTVTLHDEVLRVTRAQYRWGQEVTCRVWY